MITAHEYYKSLQQIPPLPSGDPTLDPMIGGGFLNGLVHVLIGPSSFTAPILMRTAVNSLRPRVDGGTEFQKVVYVDGLNLFNPYYISKLAVAFNLNPTVVLNSIEVARAFTWNQMVELVEEKIPVIAGADLIIIAGLTQMFEEATQDVSLQKQVRPPDVYGTKTPSVSPQAASNGFTLNRKPFHDLNRMILGLKDQITRQHPIIVLSGPFHSKSFTRPAGGQLLTHFGNVLVGIHDHPRFIRYTLEQHPFLSYRESLYWKPMTETGSHHGKPRAIADARALTLDSFMHPIRSSSPVTMPIHRED